MIRAMVVAALALAAPAIAAPAADEPTAREVAAAPPAGRESGRTDSDPGESTARTAMRGALLVPRLAATVALSPLEGAAYAFERYQLADRAERLFFNDAKTLGLLPTLSLETGSAANAGAHLLARNVFGARERFDLSASAGGRFRDRAALAFRTGELLGARLRGEVRARYERRPHDTFYGVGDASAMDLAYRHRLARVAAELDLRIVADLHLRAAAAVTDHETAGEAGAPELDVREAYDELELRWDSRGRADRWEVPSIRATGWLAAVFAGRITSLDGGRSAWRHGADLQRFFVLGRGPRVLALRAHGEAVTGPRDALPFVVLPALGGDRLLRGYAVDRFRDRVAVAGSAEYQFDLARSLSLGVFVDAGRVAGTARELALDDLRVGYGVALEAHSTTSFLARATLASSIDGGVMLTLSLDPASDVEGRTERR